GADQLVDHPHRRSRLHPAEDQAAALEILEPTREDLVPRAPGELADLAEPERARLQHVEDERAPGPAQNFERQLEGAALGVDLSGHGRSLDPGTSGKKVTIRANRFHPFAIQMTATSKRPVEEGLPRGGRVTSAEAAEHT